MNFSIRSLFLISIATSLLLGEFAAKAYFRHPISDFRKTANTMSAQEMLGKNNTSHGIFPKPPSFYVGDNAVTPINPDRIGPLRIEPVTSMDKSATIPFYHPIKSGRMIRSTLDGVSLYNESFNIDKYGRRVVPASPKNAKQYIIFSGCSFAFGLGVSDSESIPNQIQKNTKFHVYNFGVPGASVGEAIAWLKKDDLSDSIQEKKGWVSYLFIDAQIQRMMGASYFAATWGWDHPHYKLDGNKNVISDGTLEFVMPLKISFLRLLYKSALWRLISFNLPWPSKNDSYFIAQFFRNLDEVAKTKLKAKGLIVVFYPGSKFHRELIPFLEKMNIRYIDLSVWNLDAITAGRGAIPLDGHPSKEASEIVGKVLASEIEKIDAELSARH